MVDWENSIGADILPIIEFKPSSMVLVERTHDWSHSLGMLTPEDHRQIRAAVLP
jgi:hypothetical protein